MLQGVTISDAPGQVRVCYLTFNALSDVAPEEFWKPFGVEGM